MAFKLLSPDGVLHVVQHDEVASFSKKHKLRNSNVHVLLGISATSNLKLGNEKSHEANWVRLENVRWLHRDALREPLFTVGATRGRDAGLLFMSTVAAHRPDMQFSAKELKALLHGDISQTSDGWRIVRAPLDAEMRIARDGLSKHFQVRALCLQ